MARTLARHARAVLDQFEDYRQAYSGFSPTAKKYLISGFLQYVGGGMFGAIFAIYLHSSGFGTSTIGDTEAAVALGAAIVGLLGMPLISAIGYRVVMIAALALLVVSRVGAAYVPTEASLVVLSLGIGLSDGFMRAVGSAFMAHHSDDDERTHLFSVDYMVRMFAAFIGAVVGGFLPTLLRTWLAPTDALRWTILIACAVVACGLVPMVLLKERADLPRRRIRAAYRHSIVGLGSWRPIAELVAPQALIGLAGGMVVPFVPLYLKNYLGASLDQVGLVLGLSCVIVALAAFGMPVVSRKLGLGTSVALLQGLSVPFMALVFVSRWLPLAIVALWIRSVLMGMAGPIFNQLSMEGLTEHEKPAVAGWIFFALNIAWLVGSVVGGRLMTVSYTAPYAGAAVLYAGGAALMYLRWGSRRRAQTASVPAQS